MTIIGRGAVGPHITRLVLPGALRHGIDAEAARAAPEECCGILIGRVEGAAAVAKACIASPNRAVDPRTGFEIDPGLLLETQRGLRAVGEVLLGHYHSHPNGPAVPSAADRERAWVPGHVWLIAAPPPVPGETTFCAHLAVEEKGRIILRPLELITA